MAQSGQGGKNKQFLAVNVLDISLYNFWTRNVKMWKWMVIIILKQILGGMFQNYRVMFNFGQFPIFENLFLGRVGTVKIYLHTKSQVSSLKNEWAILNFIHFPNLKMLYLGTYLNIFWRECWVGGQSLVPCIILDFLL